MWLKAKKEPSFAFFSVLKQRSVEQQIEQQKSNADGASCSYWSFQILVASQSKPAKAKKR